MREYYLTLDACFRNGLRPSKGMPKSPNFMSYLLNGRPNEFGLEPYIPVIKNTDYTFEWPFPQMFVTNKHQLLGTKNSLTVINSGLTLSDLSSGIWDIISYYDYIIAAKSGTTIATRDITTGVWTTLSSSTTIPMFKTGCDYRGQAVVGNLYNWPVAGDEKPNFIAASNIGEFNFTLSLKNEALLRPMFWDGEVLSIRRIDKTVIVYGDDGIAGLFPAEQYFGLKELLGIGIYGAGAVGCSRDKHVFLGSDMRLRSIDDNFQIKLLDFKEYMSLLTGTVMISYRPHTDDFIICDGVRSFILAGEKLYEGFQLITSCGTYGSETLAGYYDTANDYFLGVTDSIDFGYRGKKTTTTIELGTGSGVYSVALDWRNKQSDSFTRTPFVAVNDNGVATLICTASEFRLCVKCEDYEDVDISYATIRYKMTDMTSLRGVYAPPPRGQQ